MSYKSKERQRVTAIPKTSFQIGTWNLHQRTDQIEYCITEPAMQKLYSISNYKRRASSILLSLACAFLLVLYDKTRSELPIQLEYWAGGVLYVMFWSYLFFAIQPEKLSPLRTCLITTLVTCLIEFTQLWHPPILENIRTYKIGYAILGTTFSWSDIPPYFLGGCLAYLGMLVVLRWTNVAGLLLSKYSEKHFLKHLRPLAELTNVITSHVSGRGVVALSDIPAGTLLGAYPGTHVPYKEFLEKEQFVSRSVKSAYMFSKDIIIDPTDIFGYLADTPDRRIALINEAPPDAQTNIVAINTRENVWYLCVQNIQAGEELFAYYGPQYQRNYSSSNPAKQIFNENHIQCLHRVAKEYRWTREGIDELFTNLLGRSVSLGNWAQNN